MIENTSSDAARLRLGLQSVPTISWTFADALHLNSKGHPSEGLLFVEILSPDTHFPGVFIENFFSMDIRYPRVLEEIRVSWGQSQSDDVCM